jgi:hypothetical protein
MAEDDDDEYDPLATAVSAAVTGIDPMRYLEADNPVDLLVMAALTEKIRKRQLEMDEDRATMIANAVAKSFNKGQ